MRIPALPALLIVLTVAPRAAAADDPGVLEQAWHACLRASFAHQSPAQGRAGSQRNALDACKAREDAFVAALMAARAGEAEAGRTGVRSLPARARAWAAAVAASVLDPVSSWIDRLRN
ncbi:hypothetical protein [uncultured Methylobacterium sp.]|uniref:hypothetical protein n=1 Tax=uncultured Methylobacterium sp. TaxID=157278 RepID=UPI0035CA97B6